MRIFALTNIRLCEYVSAMSMVRIYECLCDETRLRIIQLLTRGPLCVCHLQSVLGIPQARVSQHLSYLRERGMVENRREGTWMIYSLPPSPRRELEANLKCLQDCVQTEPVFKKDRASLAKIIGDRGVRAILDGRCCGRPAATTRKLSRKE
jgi:ArsR family transcriptional regulator